ncbi:MAG TPA: hypothetical protein VFN22_05565 [Gemmatimonadales bacterium]|nr:hypothetical protein [Gemmatimonadales bacterium]
MTRGGWSLLLLLVACARAHDPETIADIAASEGRWQDAVDALTDAEPTPNVLAKRAEAAFQSGNLRGASVDFQRLAVAAPERAGEAAAGLARTAALAGRRSDQLALTTAVLGLREVAPDWPVGRLALNLRLAPGAPAAEVIDLVPAILAGSPANDVANQSLLALGLARLELEGCPTGAPVLDALAERVDGDLGRQVLDARAGCRLDEGMVALASGDTLAARRLLDATVAMDPAGTAGRRALITLGDVYLSEGDPFAAQIAWRTAAAAPAGSDTITALALERLRTMPGPSATGEPDTL